MQTLELNGGGHVDVYAGEDTLAFYVLGGNQSDRVCVTRDSLRLPPQRYAHLFDDPLRVGLEQVGENVRPKPYVVVEKTANAT